jgi:preprotein translocase subunit YajC
MNFLIQDAWASNGAPAGPGMMDILFLVLLFVVFYFFLIRPQSKRAKEHRQMVESLAKGDEIVTNGGLSGKITQVGDNFVAVEIASNTEVKIEKFLIAKVLPKGTLKNAL